MSATAPAYFSNWLMAPIARNRALYLRVIVAAAMINLIGLITSLFTMTVYDRVLPNDAIDSLIALATGFAVLLILDFILKLLRAYFVDHAAAEIDRDVGETLFARLLGMRLDQSIRPPGVLAGSMRELETLREFFASATLTALVDVPFILLTLLVMALIGGWLVLIPALLIPLVIATALLIQPVMQRLSAQVLDEGLGKQAILAETAGGLEMVKAVGARRILLRRWRAAVATHARLAQRQRFVGAITLTLAGTVQTFSYAAVVVAGVGLIASHGLTTGGLVACSILASRAMAPLGQIASLLARLASTRAAYRELDRMMASATEGPDEGGLSPAAIAGRIEFRNVDFSYPQAGQRALRDISFTIEAGERVALVGRVGSGKSTVARLILGLYPPSQGAVLIDGADVRHYVCEDLRRHVGIVTQDAALLSGSVRDNIELERPWLDEAEMLRAARISGSDEFLGAIADGFAREIKDRGEGLSGGQRQTIALARAIAGRPAIMILDEPTSALDQETEAGVIDRLGAELAGRTLLLVTHRPAMLRLADRILVLDRGRLVADGARDAILTKLVTRKAA